MSRKKKRVFEAKPLPPVPAWLLLYEERAKAAGLKAERHAPSAGLAWWLSISPEVRGYLWNEQISFFGQHKYILNASVQDLPPKDLIAHATMVTEMLAMVAPELFENVVPPQSPEIQ